MAATVLKSMWWKYNEDGYTFPNIELGQIAASQGIYDAMHPCYQSTSGTLTKCATDATTVHGFLLDAPSAEHSANASVPWLRIRSGDVFACFVDSDGTDTTAAQTNVGNDYGITVDTTAGTMGYCTMNKNETSSTCVEVVDLMYNIEPLKFLLTASPAVVLVKFIASALVNS